MNLVARKLQKPVPRRDLKFADIVGMVFSPSTWEILRRAQVIGLSKRTPRQAMVRLPFPESGELRWSGDQSAASYQSYMGPFSSFCPRDQRS